MYEVIWWLEEEGVAYSEPATTRAEAIALAQAMYDKGAVKVQVQETIYTIRRKEEDE